MASTDPEITGTNLKRLREDANRTVTGGDLDIKNGLDLFQAFDSIEGTYGTFTIDEHGTWTYTLDNSRAATQALTQDGESGTDWFYAQSLDGSLSRAVLVVITGDKDGAPAPDTEVTLVGVTDFMA